MGHDATNESPKLGLTKQGVEALRKQLVNDSAWPHVRINPAMADELCDMALAAIVLSETAAPVFPKLEINPDIETVYIAFREEKDGDLAKNVRRSVDACIDVDAAGRVIGVELFDVPMPDENFTPMEGDR